MRLIFDNGETGNGRFVLEEGGDGLLYETSNAVTRAVVCSDPLTTRHSELALSFPRASCRTPELLDWY